MRDHMLAVVIVLFAAPVGLFGAAPTAQDCARPLTEKNLFLYNRSTAERLAWMESVDQQHFEQMKTDGSLIIPDLAGMSWSQFSEQRDRLRKELNVRYSFDETVSLLHWYGNPDATDKWLQCIKSITDASVFDSYPQLGPSENEVILKLYWRPAVEIAGTKLKLRWDVRGAKLRDQPSSLTPGEYSVILDRQGAKEIVGVVNAKVGSKYTRTSTFRVPLKVRQKVEKGSVTVRESVRPLPSPDGPVQDAHALIVTVSGPAAWSGASLSFVQDAYFEQAVVVWTEKQKFMRWGTNAWHQENLGGRLLPGREYILVAWNKPPGGSWRTSTLRAKPVEDQIEIGVDDAPVGQGDGDFNDVMIRITY